MKSAVVVIGHKGHGKTEFGLRLALQLNTLAWDTSRILTDIENWRRTYVGLPPLFQATPEDVVWAEGQVKERGLSFNDAKILAERRIKDRDRKYLIALGDAMGAADPTVMVRACMRKGRVVAGCRRIEELHTAIKDGLVYTTVWIERPDFNEGGIDNLELTKGHAQFYVENDGTLDDLDSKAGEIADQIREMGWE